MSGGARPDFDPLATLVHLDGGGDAAPVAWTITPAGGTRHRPVGAGSAGG